MEMSAHPTGREIAADGTSDRLLAYGADQAFVADLRAIWDRLSPDILAATAEHAEQPAFAPLRDVRAADGLGFADRLCGHMRLLFTAAATPAWLQSIEAIADGVADAELGTAPTALGSAALFERMADRFAATLRDDPAFFHFTQKRLLRLVAIRSEVMFGRINRRARENAAERLAASGVTFRRTVAEFLAGALTESRELRERTAVASGAARGTLGKASEVAAAAEQSAVAMREAAQTAAGLIRAIEDARSEVEVTAGVVTRAREESDKAVQVSRALSDHAHAIESILGLIRDIAGQTNLLALNATIEAARAGDAGRGFAVVAQEVKSLANQTARATDDIAAKIGAIQVATRQTVEANGAIRATVSDVQSSAERIRHAMETQAQTVTMITAAVDETALAADAMSGTIAAIRTDTDALGRDIAQLDAGFRSVDSRLATLDGSAAEFVARLG